MPAAANAEQHVAGIDVLVAHEAQELLDGKPWSAGHASSDASRRGAHEPLDLYEHHMRELIRYMRFMYAVHHQVHIHTCKCIEGRIIQLCC